MLREETHATPASESAIELRSIVFIGFMGAGKSKVGRLVAERLGIPFVDTDDLIEVRTGRSIADIFSTDGEAAFRCIETEMIAEALSGERKVIALGGGAATRDENWEIIERADAFSVYLKASPNTILERVADHTHRPLLAGLTRGEMLTKITAMLADREPKYERAQLVIPTDNTIDKHAMAERVFEILRKAATA